MSDRFPLDAEQIVRLVAFSLTRTLNALRHAEARRIDEQDVLIELADAVGVRLPVEGGRFGTTVLPYGSVTASPTASSDPRDAGGSREP